MRKCGESVILPVNISLYATTDQETPETQPLQGPTLKSHYGEEMSGSERIKQHLVDVAHHIDVLQKDLFQSREQYAAIDDMSEDARIRALVSENPLGDHNAHDMEVTRERLFKVIQSMENEIAALKVKQDELLEKLYDESSSADNE